MPQPPPTLRARLLGVAFGLALSAFAAAMAWLLWDDLSHGRTAARHGLVRLATSPVSFWLLWGKGALASAVLAVIGVYVAVASALPVRPRRRKPAARP